MYTVNKPSHRLRTNERNKNLIVKYAQKFWIYSPQINIIANLSLLHKSSIYNVFINLNVLLRLMRYSYWKSNPVPVTLESDENKTRPTPSWNVTLVGIVVPQNLQIKQNKNNKFIYSNLVKYCSTHIATWR